VLLPSVELQASLALRQAHPVEDLAEMLREGIAIGWW
jgi:hypothetical protein